MRCLHWKPVNFDARMPQKYPSPVLSDTEIEQAFAGTNFGTTKFRPLLEQGVLSVTCGFDVGHTLFVAMQKLALVTPKHRVTKKGKALLMEAFYVGA